MRGSYLGLAAHVLRNDKANQLSNCVFLEDGIHKEVCALAVSIEQLPADHEKARLPVALWSKGGLGLNIKLQSACIAIPAS